MLNISGEQERKDGSKVFMLFQLLKRLVVTVLSIYLGKPFAGEETGQDHDQL